MAEPQRHHKEPGLAIPGAARIKARRAFAVVHLRFLAGQELQAVELLGLPSAQPPAKALHAVIALREPESIHQLLVNRRGVAPQAYL